MKKAAIFAAALALVLTLAACGNQGNTGGTTGAGSPAGTGDSLTDDANSTTRSWAGNQTNADNQTRSWSGSDNQTGTRGTVGNDLRRAADGVGSAVEDAVDDGRDMLTRTASATTFEQMLDNARVHDTDGVLTDGENSRW